MVAEGNFYVSEVVMRRELRSNFAKAMTHCKEQSAAYAKCVDAAQVNRNLNRDVCAPERLELRKCVDGGRAALRDKALQSRNPLK